MTATAATIEDFLNAFADVSGRDLPQFAPLVRAGRHARTSPSPAAHDAAGATLHAVDDRADARRRRPASAQASCMHIPVCSPSVSSARRPRRPLRPATGCDRRERRHSLRQGGRRYASSLGVSSPAGAVSIRGFSAPVHAVARAAERGFSFLLAARHAMPSRAGRPTRQTVADAPAGQRSPRPGSRPIRRRDLARLAAPSPMDEDALDDPPFAALALTLPERGRHRAARSGRTSTPTSIHRARDRNADAASAARLHRARCTRFYESLTAVGAAARTRSSAGRPRPAQYAASIFSRRPTRRAGAGARHARNSIPRSNMTDRLAVAERSRPPCPAHRAARDRRLRRPLPQRAARARQMVHLQAAIPEDDTLERVKAPACDHPAFSIANPNRVRALIGSFAMLNQIQFNRADGAGYRPPRLHRAARGRAESPACGAASDRFQHLAHDGFSPSGTCRTGPAIHRAKAQSFPGCRRYREPFPRNGPVK